MGRSAQGRVSTHQHAARIRPLGAAFAAAAARTGGRLALRSGVGTAPARRDGLPPSELVAIGREDVERYDVVLVDGTVTAIVKDGASGFRVEPCEGPSVTARRLLLATGLRDEIPDIPGLRERWAKDVLHCPYCHGFEVRDWKLGVLGGSPAAIRYAQIVRQWSDDLVYVAPAGTLAAAERQELTARGIRLAEGTATCVLVDGDQIAASSSTATTSWTATRCSSHRDSSPTAVPRVGHGVDDRDGRVARTTAPGHLRHSASHVIERSYPAIRCATSYFVTDVRRPGVSPAGIAFSVSSPCL